MWCNLKTHAPLCVEHDGLHIAPLSHVLQPLLRDELAQLASLLCFEDLVPWHLASVEMVKGAKPIVQLRLVKVLEDGAHALPLHLLMLVQ